MQLETISCKSGQNCAAGNAPMKLGALQISADFIQVCTDLCDRKCSNAAGNDFMKIRTYLYNRECFGETNCWQDLHFEFPHPNLNLKMQSSSMW